MGSPAVLLVADLFHPVGGFTVEMFLNGDMRHTRGCRGSMPVFLTRRDPDNITLLDFLDLTAPLLNPVGASRHDQGLARRMGVPCRPGAWLERDTDPEAISVIHRPSLVLQAECGSGH